MKTNLITEDYYHDFWTVIQMHLHDVCALHGIDKTAYDNMTEVERAKALHIPDGVLKGIGRFIDDSGKQVRHTKAFLARLGIEGKAVYHPHVARRYSSGEVCTVPSWIEPSAECMEAIIGTDFRANLTERQRKMAKKHFKNKESEEDMTKAEKENLRLECEKGLHGLDYDTLVKDAEKKERRAKRTQEKRLEKIANGVFNQRYNDESESIYYREELRKRDERIAELEREVDELKAQLDEEASWMEKPITDEQLEKNFQACLETCEKYKDALRDPNAPHVVPDEDVRDGRPNVPEEDLDEVETAHEEYVKANAETSKKLIQSAFSHGVISRDNARMFAKLMFQDAYYKFKGTDQYCAQTMLMEENEAMRVEYLNLVNEMWKTVKPHYGTQFYDEETNRWIKGRLSVAKTYLGQIKNRK